MKAVRANSEERSRRTIEADTRFILSEKGIAYCAKNAILVRDIVTGDGSKKTGLHWKSFDAGIIQRMFVNRLISEIEVSQNELLTSRIAIIDLTKLLVYGILYKRFRPSMKNSLAQSSVLKETLGAGWFDASQQDIQLKQSVVTRFAQEKKDIIDELKNLLAVEPLRKIANEPGLTRGERIIRENTLYQFIDSIDTSIWFLMNFANRGSDRAALLGQMQHNLMQYLDKTKVADYIALVVMELAQNAERAHYQRLARLKKGNLSERDLAQLLKNPLFRHSLTTPENINRRKLAIQFSHTRISIRNEERIKLQISVRNRGALQEKNRRHINEKSNRDVNGKSIATFYKEKNQETLGAGLGLYYLSYLEEACHSVDIKIETRVVSDQTRDETLTMVIAYI